MKEPSQEVIPAWPEMPVEELDCYNLEGSFDVPTFVRLGRRPGGEVPFAPPGREAAFIPPPVYGGRSYQDT